MRIKFGVYVVKHYFCIRIRERTALQNMMKKTFRKTSENIWKYEIKVLIFASTFAKKAGASKKSSLKTLHYQQVVQVLKINTVKNLK